MKHLLRPIVCHAAARPAHWLNKPTVWAASAALEQTGTLPGRVCVCVCVCVCVNVHVRLCLFMVMRVFAYVRVRLCVSMWVCVRVCSLSGVCVCPCAFVCVHVHALVCVYLRVRLCVYVHVFVRVYVCVCSWSCVCVCLYACAFVCVYVHVSLCAYVHMRLCVCVLVWSQCKVMYGCMPPEKMTLLVPLMRDEGKKPKVKVSRASFFPRITPTVQRCDQKIGCVCVWGGGGGRQSDGESV